MAKSCAVVPRFKNKQTEELEDSRLFKDLLSFTSSRLRTEDLYRRIKNEKFIPDNINKIEIDDLGEPTFNSIRRAGYFKNLIEEAELIKQYNKRVGGLTQSGEVRNYIKNQENWDLLRGNAAEFNGSNEGRDFIARVTEKPDSESNRTFWVIYVEKRNKMNSYEASQQDFDYRLNKKLRNILENLGVGIGVINEAEKRLKLAGVTDFSVSEKTANGLIEIIRLAKGEIGESALPEEFAHVALEALGDHILVTRLVNAIVNNNLTESILGNDYITYKEAYKDDETQLAKEAAGKLVAKQLLQNKSTETPVKNLVTRVVGAIKDFFKTWNASSFRMAIQEARANQTSSVIARELITGDLSSQMKLENITETRQFYQTESKVNRLVETLDKILRNEHKRVEVYKNRKGDMSKFETDRLNMLNDIEYYVATNDERKAIALYVQTTLKDLRSIEHRIEGVSSPDVSVEKRAATLMHTHNYIDSYETSLKDLQELHYETINDPENKLDSILIASIQEAQQLLNAVRYKNNALLLPTFVEGVRPLVGDNIINNMLKSRGENASIEEIFTTAKKDISWVHTWLTPLSENPDDAFRLIDIMVKKAKDQRRRRVIEVRKEIISLGLEYEEKGIKNYEPFFEKDKNDVPTQNMIRDIDYSKFNENKGKFIESLTEIYGDPDVVNNTAPVKKAWSKWYLENTEKDGSPKKSVYASSQFNKLTPIQKEFYTKWLNLKMEYDLLLPDGVTNLHDAIRIRKDYVERAKGSKSLKELLNETGRSIEDTFVIRTDETEMGVKTDFAGREVEVLPIYYTSKLEKGKDLSFDMISSLVAYADMAINFDEMNKINDIIEIGRKITRERKVPVYKGGKPVMETINGVAQPLTIAGEVSNLTKRMDGYIAMNVYGKRKADEGSFKFFGKDVSWSKAADGVNRYTSLLTMSFAPALAFNNVVMGQAQIHIEAAAAEWVDAKSLFKAETLYGRDLPAFVAQLGKRAITNKLGLFAERFDILQDFDTEGKAVDFYRRTKFSRALQLSTLFFLQHAGEHYLQVKMAIAMSDKIMKVKNQRGKILSLYEAMTVEYLDPKNKNRGARLVLPEGYTKLDGTPLTYKDEQAFTLQVHKINQYLHGIYNEIDKAYAQQKAIGRLAFMFRKWVPISLTRRFAKRKYIPQLDSYREGYHLTTYRFFAQSLKEWKQTEHTIKTRWKSLTKHEQANIRRTALDYAQLLIVYMLKSALSDWDDKENPWAQRMTIYQLERLYTEIGALTPGWWMANEATQIMDSPMAGVRTIQSITDVIGTILTPAQWMQVKKSGRFKDYPVIIAALSKLVPVQGGLYKGLHPEEYIAWFRQ